MALKIKDLHKSDMERLLEYFVERYPEDARKIYRDEPPTQIRLAVDFLHSSLCKSTHPPCTYYDEEDISSSWSLPEHRNWHQIYELLVDKLDIGPTEFVDLIQGVRRMQEEVERERKNWNPHIGPFLAALLELRPDLLSPSYQKVSGLEQPSEYVDGMIETEEGSSPLSETDQ